MYLNLIFCPSFLYLYCMNPSFLFDCGDGERLSVKGEVVGVEGGEGEDGGGEDGGGSDSYQILSTPPRTAIWNVRTKSQYVFVPIRCRTLTGM